MIVNLLSERRVSLRVDEAEKVPRRASNNEAQGDLDSRNSSDMTTCMIMHDYACTVAAGACRGVSTIPLICVPQVT